MKCRSSAEKRKYAAAAYLLSWMSGLTILLWKGTGREPCIRWHAVQSTVYGLIVFALAILGLLTGDISVYYALLLTGWISGLMISYIVYTRGDFSIPVASQITDVLTG